MSATIKPGDVVVAIHGGPKMTVESVNIGDVHVVWFGREDQLLRAVLKAESLKVVA